MYWWDSRNLLIREFKILTRVYKTMIRPKLEYCDIMSKYGIKLRAIAISQLF